MDNILDKKLACIAYCKTVLELTIASINEDWFVAARSNYDFMPDKNIGAKTRLLYFKVRMIKDFLSTLDEIEKDIKQNATP